MESKEATEISRKIGDLFAASSKQADPNYRWTFLKDYHSRYLSSGEISPLLLSNYLFVASTLLDSVQPTVFENKAQEKIFDDIFLHSIHHEAFMILVRKLDSSSPSYLQLKVLNLLKQFLKNHNMHSLILHQCLSSGKWDPEYISSSKMWSDLITFIVSLPERVANKTKGQMPKIFHTDFYIPLLASSILKTLSSLHEKIRESRDCTLEFIGKLLGKLCVLGHGDIISKNLYLAIIKHSESDHIWRRMSQNLITKLPFVSLEPFLTNLLFIVPWYGYLDWILGDLVLKNDQLNYILTKKLFFFRHFKNVLILQNIIGYFASSDKRRPHFWTILRSLVKTWSDQDTVKHQSLDQQKYFASALVICTGWVETTDIAESKALVDQTLQGTMVRIGNSEEYVRSLGMIVGSLLISAFDPEAPKLEFENIMSTQLQSEFKDLMKIPNNPGLDSLCYTEGIHCFEEEYLKSEAKTSVTKENDSATSGIITEIDSDDDLEAYDLSNDVPQAQAKRPLYLLDCLKGLIEQEKPDWYEQCLKHAESLIEGNADSVHEIAVEMTKVLLHSDDKFSTTDFLTLRHRILVSLAVHCPILVATYLTTQFYEDEYNIRQRLDMLEVLAQSSQQLSKPKEALLDPQLQHSKEKFMAHAEKSWQSIVEERIAAKTRYIAKTPRKMIPEMMENQFSDVAGYFFFPLLAKYDKMNKRLQLFGEDSYVLGRLTYTLGTIMYAALNIPISEKMGSALLKFLADVRNHNDVFVRQAAIFATASVYTSVPGYLLFSEMTAVVLESQQWLQDVIEKDPDTNCQVRASYALALILRIMKEEMPLMSELKIL